MAYKIIKPEVTSVSRAVWSKAKISWIFWVILITSLFLTLYSLFVALDTIRTTDQMSLLAAIFWPACFPLVYLLWLQHQVATSFWKQIAGINGWQYKDNSDVSNESGIMFKQGNGRMMNHYINGVIEGRQFRIFNYMFGIGSGEHRKIYKYTVFAFKFDGTFPHIYLNNKHNSYSVKTGEQVSLPSEFEKQFVLSAPRRHEIEALEIFTPDILSKLLDMKLIHDIEFVEQEMIIFADGVVSDFEKLEKEFNMAIELENLLDKKLDKFKFEKIGDMSHNLK